MASSPDKKENRMSQTTEVAIGNPMFQHDGCANCVFLGTYQHTSDLWYCPQGGLPTVIARTSSNGPDYISGMYSAPHIPALAEAKRRAVSRGFKCEPEKVS